MTTSIDLKDVTLDYNLYSVRAQSLRNAVLNMAVGGRLMRSGKDVTVIRALSNISLNLREGDRLALVGHNGSGKTSLLKVLAGIYEPTAGVVDVRGRISSMISMSIGLDAEASGLQNIRNLAMMQMMPDREIKRRLPDIVEFSELGAFVHMPFKTYSAGMMARLTFSVATQMDADILIMDEWISAGDAEFQKKAAARLTSMVDKAKIVVIATHDLKLAATVSNRVMTMEAGVPTFLGTTAEWVERSNPA
ncbi:MAG: ABC transporter ATP-binding protein [bacterium]|nr:ABC transporter ATP-binding protein [Alphaproteobacteria bacterium]MDI1364218.1 ABC transporter ATP-binding protein [bacterium]